MIEQSKLKQLEELFGKELPPRHLFFATRQTNQIVTPAVLKGLYHEPTLSKAFQKLVEDFKLFVNRPVEKVAPVVVPKPATVVVKEDE